MLRFGILTMLVCSLFLSLGEAQAEDSQPPLCLQFDDQYTNRVQIDLTTGAKIGGELNSMIADAIQGATTRPQVLTSPNGQETIIQLKTTEPRVIFGLMPADVIGAPLYLGSDANDGFWHDEVMWSPDSHWISYLTNRGDDGYFLSIVDSNGHLQHEQLISTRLEDSVSSYGWSGDGRYVAVSVSDSYAGPLRKIEIWSVPDLTLTKLIKPQFADGNPRPFGDEVPRPDRIQWNAQGDWLAYLYHPMDGMVDEYILNLYSPDTDKTLTYDLPGVANDYGNQILWSPNGQYIAILSTQFTDELIGRIDIFGIDGQIFENVSDKVLHYRILADGGLGFPFSIWSADGHALIFVEQLPAKSHNLGALVAYAPEKMEKIEISPHIYMNPNTENGNRYLFARSPDDGQDHTTPGNTDLREDSLVVVDTNTLEQISVAALRSRPYLSQVYGTYSDSGWLFLSEDEVMTWAVNFLTGEKVAFFASGEIEENWDHLPQYLPVLDTELVARMDRDSNDDWTVSIRSLRDGSSRKIDHSFPEPIYDIAITPERDWIAVHYRGTLEILKPDGSTLWRFDDMGAFNVKNLTFTTCSGALASEHATFVSPDGQYKVVTYVYAASGVAMPGQGGDRGGYARVFDANGNIICEIDVPLVNDVNENSVRWRDGAVSVPGVDGFESCDLG